MRQLIIGVGLAQDKAIPIRQRCHRETPQAFGVGVALGGRVAVEMRGLDVEVPDFISECTGGINPIKAANGSPTCSRNHLFHRSLHTY